MGEASGHFIARDSCLSEDISILDDLKYSV